MSIFGTSIFFYLFQIKPIKTSIKVCFKIELYTPGQTNSKLLFAILLEKRFLFFVYYVRSVTFRFLRTKLIVEIMMSFTSDLAS